jgi:hypothetical protein
VYNLNAISKPEFNALVNGALGFPLKSVLCAKNPS